jgi:hypothetical protein
MLKFPTAEKSPRRLGPAALHGATGTAVPTVGGQKDFDEEKKTMNTAERKRRDLELLERDIMDALRKLTVLKTGEFLETSEILRHFHGVRTLTVSQVGPVARRMAVEGKIVRMQFGNGRFQGSEYRLKLQGE